MHHSIWATYFALLSIFFAQSRFLAPNMNSVSIGIPEASCAIISSHPWVGRFIIAIFLYQGMLLQLATSLLFSSLFLILSLLSGLFFLTIAIFFPLFHAQCMWCLRLKNLITSDYDLEHCSTWTSLIPICIPSFLLLSVFIKLLTFFWHVSLSAKTLSLTTLLSVPILSNLIVNIGQAEFSLLFLPKISQNSITFTHKSNWSHTLRS